MGERLHRALSEGNVCGRGQEDRDLQEARDLDPCFQRALHVVLALPLLPGEEGRCEHTS